MTKPKHKFQKCLCELCGEIIDYNEGAIYPRADGPDDFTEEQAHQDCLDALAERMQTVEWSE